MLFRRHPRNNTILTGLFLVVGSVLTVLALREGNWDSWLAGVALMAGIGGIELWQREQKVARLEAENAELRTRLSVPPAA